MAQGKDQLDDRSQPGSQQARANIDVTRQAMDRTIEAIEGKLTPGQLLMEGLSLLGKGGTTGANKLVELAREHPVPAAVIGVGVGMMIRDAATKKTEGGRMPAGGLRLRVRLRGRIPRRVRSCLRRGSRGRLAHRARREGAGGGGSPERPRDRVPHGS
jgi:hypothetical protein